MTICHAFFAKSGSLSGWLSECDDFTAYHSDHGFSLGAVPLVSKVLTFITAELASARMFASSAVGCFAR